MVGGLRERQGGNLLSGNRERVVEEKPTFYYCQFCARTNSCVYAWDDYNMCDTKDEALRGTCLAEK